MNDIPCRCGHRKEVHDFEPYTYFKGIHGEDSFCSFCYRIRSRFGQHVHKYVPDNLILIEQLAKQRGLI